VGLQQQVRVRTSNCACKRTISVSIAGKVRSDGNAETTQELRLRVLSLFNRQMGGWEMALARQLRLQLPTAPSREVQENTPP
jgi:hypothetical protein